MRNVIIMGVCVLAAGAGYAVMGEPGRADMPYSARAADLASKDAASLTGPEQLARLESLSQARPNDPQPQYYIGMLMKAQGRPEDAMRYYQRALRRDETFVPALKGLADTLTRMNGMQVGPETAALYLRLYQLEPSNVRAGFLASMPDWDAGNKAQARAWWNEMRANVAFESAEGALLEGLISATDPGNMRAVE